ncbi:MAG: (d)CMP kinase [Dissulfurispiraceae bacterium]|jgi:cytidylate kinase|nr:(d)CMP kinase [Dissulfurispiraceae bacterium]
MKRVVAIDGPSGSGKSTISRMLAERLGFQFLDTGALYRALGIYLDRKGVDHEDSDAALRSGIGVVNIELSGDKVLLGGEDVSDIIRTPSAGHLASVFSARRPVREYLFSLQRNAAAKNDIVAEGRDMTTVVFPDAWIKFFLDASVEERARRRFQQLLEKGMDITMDQALADVRDRDLRDSSRDIAPLKKSEDSILIDSTNISISSVVEEMIRHLPAEINSKQP